jgi:hypothetical protein
MHLLQNNVKLWRRANGAVVFLFFCLDVSHGCGPSILHDDRGWGWIEERGRGSRLFCIAQSEGSVFEDFDFFIFGDGENVLHGMCSGMSGWKQQLWSVGVVRG